MASLSLFSRKIYPICTLFLVTFFFSTFECSRVGLQTTVKTSKIFAEILTFFGQNLEISETVQKFATIRSFCIPKTSQYLERQEGRHSCAYNSSGNFRAVGVGYNLDDNPETAKLELGTLTLDYEKVYNGSQCLNDFQITFLLLLTSNRALDLAAEQASSLDQWCCDIQKVYADVALTTWGSAKPWRDLSDFVDKTSAQAWKAAAEALEETDWCDNYDERCEEAKRVIRRGCDGCDREG